MRPATAGIIATLTAFSVITGIGVACQQPTTTNYPNAELSKTMHDPVTRSDFEEAQHRTYVRETLDAMVAPSPVDAATIANRSAG